MRRSVLFLSGVALSVAACDDSTGLGRQRGGHFPLVAINDLALPATVGELVGRDFKPTGCFEVVTRGWLTLDARAARFSLGAHHQDSCGRTSFGGDTSAYGRYEIAGNEVVLYGEAGPGRVEVLRAAIHRTAIELSALGWRYRFAR